MQYSSKQQQTFVFVSVWSSLVAEYGSTGQGCQSRSWSAEKDIIYFPCPRSRLRIWSSETGLAVSSRVSLLIPHTPAESGSYLRDSSRFPRRRPFIYLHRQPPSGQSRVLSGHAFAYRRRSLPRARRYGASSPQGSSTNGCCI